MAVKSFASEGIAFTFFARGKTLRSDYLHSLEAKLNIEVLGVFNSGIDDEHGVTSCLCAPAPLYALDAAKWYHLPSSLYYRDNIRRRLLVQRCVRAVFSSVTS